MKQLLIVSTLLLLHSCSVDTATYYQEFPDYNVALSCPCLLKNDTAREHDIARKARTNTKSFSCKDSISSDIYRFDVLLDSRRFNSTDQTLSNIDSTLNARGIRHQRIIAKDYKGMKINYDKAIELEMFTDKYVYYLIIEASDSLEKKLYEYAIYDS